MSKLRPIYRSDGEWMALLYKGHLFDTQGEWVGWLDGDAVYAADGEYVGYINKDGRLLRQRVLPYHKRRRPPAQRPQIQAPPSVPLPPMFAELSYDTVDVFEETPKIFATVNELRPDAGEKSLPRLLDTDPRLAARQRLRRVKYEMLEEMVYGLIYSYGATEPPVPIEAMVAGLRPNSAGESMMAPPHERLRLARQLIEKLSCSQWAARRGYVGPEGLSPAQIDYAARALLLPRHWLLKIPQALRRPAFLAQHYLAPEEIVVLRLHDLE
jgi:hypothetical protein